MRSERVSRQKKASLTGFISGPVEAADGLREPAGHVGERGDALGLLPRQIPGPPVHITTANVLSLAVGGLFSACYWYMI